MKCHKVRFIGGGPDDGRHATFTRQPPLNYIVETEAGNRHCYMLAVDDNDQYVYCYSEVLACEGK